MLKHGINKVFAAQPFGCMVNHCAGRGLYPSLNRKIGKGCIVNTCSSIDHDCRIGNYSHIAVGSHICGTVEIGSRCWIGAGSIISNNISKG